MTTDRIVSEHDSEVDKLLVFVHIPKTAGTTLNSIFAHQYAPNMIYKIMMRGMSWIVPQKMMLPRPLISSSKLRRFKSALNDRPYLQVVHGHFDMSLSELLPRSAEFITLLRDPVERAISHYYHYRKLTADPVHPLAIRSTLTEWVSTCGLVEMDNGQTRRLAGEMGLPIGKVTSRTLDKAKANLANKFTVFGLTERFDEFQILLHYRFKWPYCRYPVRNAGNQRLQRNEMSDHMLKVVENCNQFDRELYQFASELFEHAISKVDMDRELLLLKTASVHIEPTCSKLNCSTPASSGFISQLRCRFSTQRIQNLVQ